MCNNTWHNSSSIARSEHGQYAMIFVDDCYLSNIMLIDLCAWTERDNTWPAVYRCGHLAWSTKVNDL